MVACRLSAGLFVLPFGMWILVREPRRAVAVGAVAALAFAPWALLHHRLYGNLVGPSVVQMAGDCWSDGAFEAMLGVLFSPGRGLFVYQPWLVLFILAPLAVGRRGGAAPPGWWAFCLTFAALHIGLVSAWGCWWGGHCWGSRLASEVVPLLALLCVRPVSLLLRSAAWRWVVAAAALASIWVHASAVYLRADRWNDRHITDRPERMLWSWSDPPFFCVGRSNPLAR
jgi:hypothetical protein